MLNNYIPKEHRKKLLLISDDCRLFSGVGSQSRELILNTAHYYNWIQIASALSHPDAGKAIDLSEAVNKEIGITDSQVKLFPFSGYGDPHFVRFLIGTEKPNGIVLITDPRYFVHIFEMEHEIRSKGIPIIYWSLWDYAPPYPMYNYPYYKSCDALFGISKQSHNLHKHVLNKKDENNWEVISYGN